MLMCSTQTSRFETLPLKYFVEDVLKCPIHNGVQSTWIETLVGTPYIFYGLIPRKTRSFEIPNKRPRGVHALVGLQWVALHEFSQAARSPLSN
jgi:hypothetical protein